MAIEESWNAIGCCDGAAKLKIDDVGFIEKLVPRSTRARAADLLRRLQHRRPLVYTLECTDPALADGMAAVKADPMPGCVVTQPMNVLVFSSLDDKYVPYKPGEKGLETPPATVQIARLAGHGPQGCLAAANDRHRSVKARHDDPQHLVLRRREDASRWVVLPDAGRPRFPGPRRRSRAGRSTSSSGPSSPRRPRWRRYRAEAREPR